MTSELKKHNCVVCGNPVEPFDVCERCGWEDDNGEDNHADAPWGPNDMSLKAAREKYRKFGFVYKFDQSGAEDNDR